MDEYHITQGITVRFMNAYLQNLALLHAYAKIAVYYSRVLRYSPSGLTDLGILENRDLVIIFYDLR